ncbi:MAG: aldo/keto reductase [Chloroflexia bacterium]
MIPQRPLGTTGLTVSALGYGGAPIGFADPGHAGDFPALLRRALDLGITFFDTAPDYRESEALLGEALEGRRGDVVLATKCGRQQSRVAGGWQASEDWTEAGVAAQIESSLRHLRTDYLDLVQLHSPPRWVLDDGAALRGLEHARDAGKVLHIGISAAHPDAGYEIGLGVFETLQVSYSILQQEPGADTLPAAAARGIGLIVKQPVANGIPDMPDRPAHPDWSGKWDVAQRMDWASLGAPTDRTALALRWVLSNPLVSTAIVGTSDLRHLEKNAVPAAEPPLDGASLRRIEDAYYAARRRLGGEDAT